MADKARLRMFLVGGPLTLVGLIVLLIGLRYAGNEAPAEENITTRGLLLVSAGAVMFAVGGMVTLVAIVRPLFQKRSIDERAERERR
jgi:hypothetical protein